MPHVRWKFSIHLHNNSIFDYCLNNSFELDDANVKEGCSNHITFQSVQKTTAKFISSIFLGYLRIELMKKGATILVVVDTTMQKVGANNRAYS